MQRKLAVRSRNGARGRRHWWRQFFPQANSQLCDCWVLNYEAKTKGSLWKQFHQFVRAFDPPRLLLMHASIWCILSIPKELLWCVLKLSNVSRYNDERMWENLPNAPVIAHDSDVTVNANFLYGFPIATKLSCYCWWAFYCEAMQRPSLRKRYNHLKRVFDRRRSIGSLSIHQIDACIKLMH